VHDLEPLRPEFVARDRRTVSAGARREEERLGVRTPDKIAEERLVVVRRDVRDLPSLEIDEVEVVVPAALGQPREGEELAVR
jgi:hypothetical protein